MIEVEKKFQPTEEQLKKLLSESEFVKEKEIHDSYYDFPDFRLFKKGNRLRKRNTGFELKVYTGSTSSGVQTAQEYEDEKSIKRELGLAENDISLKEIIAREMEIVCDFKTIRREYKKDDFVIDVDSMDFGVDVVEIELLVEIESQMIEAEKKILELAKSAGMEAKDLPLKTEMYLQKMKPGIHKQIFGTKKENSEIKRLK